MSGSGRSNDHLDAVSKYAPKWARGGNGESESSVVVRLPHASQSALLSHLDELRRQFPDLLSPQRPNKPPPSRGNSTNVFDGDVAHEKQVAHISLAPEFVRQPPESERRRVHLGKVVFLTAGAVLAAVVALAFVVVIPDLLPKAAQQSNETRNNRLARPLDAQPVAASSAPVQRVVVDSGPRFGNDRTRSSMKAAASIVTTEAGARMTPANVPSSPPLPSALSVQQPTYAGAAFAIVDSATAAPAAPFPQNAIAPAPMSVQQSVDFAAAAFANAQLSDPRRQPEQFLAGHHSTPQRRPTQSVEKPTPTFANRQKNNKRPYRQNKPLSVEADNGG